MTINLDVQNIEDNPGVTKRVTLDSEVLVPVGAQGDEKYMLSASTAAYADNEARSAIQTLYISGGKMGWSKSSGFKGTNGKFALDSSNYMLSVKLDATVSGTNESGAYEVALDHNNGIEITGENVAIDLQAKLRAINCEVADTGFQLAYTNCFVAFKDNKFHISSGTISNYFTGLARSSVLVGTATMNDCSVMLGFDHQVTTEHLTDITILEAPILTDYTADTATITTGLYAGVSTGDSMYITDGINSDYFTVLNVASNVLTVPTNATNNFIGISSDYTTASGTYVQVVSKTDPDNTPDNYYRDTDELLRYMATIMINQIDFTS